MIVLPIIKKKIWISILALLFCILIPLSASGKDIKIGLAITNKAFIISSDTNAKLINQLNDHEIQTIQKNSSFLIQNKDGLINIVNKRTNVPIGSFIGPIKLTTYKNSGLVSYNNNWYRGELIILTNNNKQDLTVINNINLEDYLLSVVPSEIPYSWHKETLKAQAIAARSYSLGYLGRRKSKGYDLESTVEDQVYLGVAAEKDPTSKAVKETEGLILVDENNKPLVALYHSSGGGYTDSIENLWDKTIKEPSMFIQPRPDYDDNSPHFEWYRKFSSHEINNLLSELKIGEIINITPVSKSISNRITWLKITGSNGESTLRGEELRRKLKLPSSMFNLSIENTNFNFAGRGYGHGLGLSQWGSKNLAEKGFTHDQILKHYYAGAMIVKWSEIQ